VERWKSIQYTKKLLQNIYANIEKYGMGCDAGRTLPLARLKAGVTGGGLR
jgi:hypothetical protein